MMELKFLEIQEFKKLKEQGLTVLDIRSPRQFAEGLVPGSINIARNELFGKLMRRLLLEDQALLIVAEPGSEEVLFKELQTLGFEEVKGFLKGGFEAWQAAGEPIDVVIATDTEELLIDRRFGQPVILDLRPENEFQGEHLAGSRNISLEEMLQEVDDYASNKTYYVLSRPSSEAMTAISYLKLEGKHNFYYLNEGFEALKDAGADMVMPGKKKPG
ncbi:MAG: rhodanese-like domain-containing protein [Bacteroidia bacterium]